MYTEKQVSAPLIREPVRPDRENQWRRTKLLALKSQVISIDSVYIYAENQVSVPLMCEPVRPDRETQWCRAKVLILTVTC